MSCPFRLAVINDEITQDFGRACEIASKDFGLSWIELRGMWNKNIVDLDSAEVAEARKILEKNKLRVTDIASPLFKVDWPGALSLKADSAATSLAPSSISNSRTRYWSAALNSPKHFKQTAYGVSISGGWMIRNPIEPPSTISCAKPQNAAGRAARFCCLKMKCRAIRQLVKRRPLSCTQFLIRTLC